MLESFVNATALPNLHPAVVHLPIVLIPLALILDALGTALFGQKWFRPAATSLWVAAALSAWLAVWAGEQAADGLTDVPPQVQPRIGEHSDWAHYTLYAVAVLGLLRLVLHFHPKLKERRLAYSGFVVLGSFALFPLVMTADLGGELVYQHGLGVGVLDEHSEDLHEGMDAEMLGADHQVPGQTGLSTSDRGSGSSSAASTSLVTASDGTVTWTPQAGQGNALSTLFSAPSGQDLSAIREAEDVAGEGEGLLLQINGKATLLLAEPFSDVQVEALIELIDFQGQVGVVHHATETDGGFFTLSTEAEGKLIDVREGETNQLARETVQIPSGSFEMAVSSAGRHLKGLVDGATVVHGHVAPGPGRGAGLFFDGQGGIRLLKLRAIPLGGH